MEWVAEMKHRIDGEMVRIRAFLERLPPECFGGFLEERVAALKQKKPGPSGRPVLSVGDASVEEWREFGEIKAAVQRRYSSFRELHEVRVGGGREA